jgi:hypothetical protein
MNIKIDGECLGPFLEAIMIEILERIARELTV